MKTRLLLLAALTLVACDDKKDETKAAPSASATMTASAPPPQASTPAATASAAPSAAASSGSGSGSPAQTSTKDPTVAVQDPVKDPAKSVKADVGTSVSLYLPKWAGTTWKVKESPKPLGKAKEETIPGFAGPTTPAAAFIWKLNDPSLKAGQSLKVTIEATAKDQPAKTFTLTIDLV